MTAQVVGDSLRIKLQDQSSITGKLIEKKGDDWLVETKSAGNISLKRQNMVHFDVLTTSKNNAFKRLAPPNYWLAHTALPLQKGEGYYQNSELIFHSVNYGFTKYFSVSAGFEILSLVDSEFSGQGSFPVFSYVSPRVSYPLSSDLHLSTGILIGRDKEGALFNGFNNALTVFYTTATLGNRDRNFSVTFGHRLEKIPNRGRFRPSPFAPTKDMNFINLAGKIHLTQNWVIISETWSWTSVFTQTRTLVLNMGLCYSAQQFNVGFGVLKSIFDGGQSNFPLLTVVFPF
ncbi:MAG: hypothetical protein RIS64_3206 [Bacteroidota bacterium]|jgi:hypothetical protein